MFDSLTSNPIDYGNSGFNGFLSRSIKSNPTVMTLQQMSGLAGSNMINFDQTQTSGSLGDKIQVGGIIIDGTNRRIVLLDETNTEVGWIGNLNA